MKFREFNVSSASRTDAGVHALGQILKIGIPLDIEPSLLKRGLNSLLPTDIRVMEVDRCESSFNPLKECKSKIYRYQFSDQTPLSPMLVGTVTSVSEKLDISKMQEACLEFVGTHDFSNWYAKDSKVARTERTLFSCVIKKVEMGPLHPNVHALEIEGDGFLKQMIRYIIGALFKVGMGKISIDEVKEYLNYEKEDKLSPKAPSQGLCLVEIIY